MSRASVLGLIACMLAGTLLSLAAAPVAAQTTILTHKGTKVYLTILDPVDTAKASRGDKVRFKVAQNVVVDEHVVIKKGTWLVGTIKQVGHPFPQNAGFANISSLAVLTIDRKPVALHDVRIGASVFGGDVQVSAGTLMSTTTKADAMVTIPE